MHASISTKARWRAGAPRVVQRGYGPQRAHHRVLQHLHQVVQVQIILGGFEGEGFEMHIMRMGSAARMGHSCGVAAVPGCCLQQRAASAWQTGRPLAG